MSHYYTLCSFQLINSVITTMDNDSYALQMLLLVSQGTQLDQPLVLGMRIPIRVQSDW